MENITEKALKYGDFLYAYFPFEDVICHDKAEFHFMMYVVSGKLTVTENEKEYEISKGQSVFVRRDHRVSFTKYAFEDEPFQSVTIKFSRNSMRKYYQTYKIDNNLKNIQPLKSSVRIMEKSPYLDSLFLSFLPFFETETAPNEEFIDQKMNEGITTLLSLDKGFYPAIFDFVEQWKIDILDFLNENYTYDLTMEEIASYTGRSLATFKRDFAKISDLTPQRWITEKRLQRAYDFLKEGKVKVNDVCYNVGFKNRSHFSLAFKKHFGYSPADVETIGHR